MSKSDYKKANAFLENEIDGLGLIFHKIKKLEELNVLIKKFLPEHVQQFCQVANYYHQDVVIQVANAALATQLRLHSNEYLAQFKKIPQLMFIKNVHFKVRPHFHQKNKRIESKKIAFLSEETATIVDEIADGISDKKLREAMKKIAKHKKSRDGSHG